MVVLLVVLVFAGGSSSAVVFGATAKSKPLSAREQEKRLGPKPTPRWYWRWQAWRLGEGQATGHRVRRALRPRGAPQRVPRWAWRRLHLFVLARAHRRPTQRALPSAGAGSYDEAISYTQRRPSFTPTRVVDVSDGAELQSAISSLQAGDLVEATSPFTVSGTTVIKNRLSSPAELDLSGVRFVYSGGRNYPAVWLDDAENVRIYGGDTSTADTGGSCVDVYGSQHVLWWGFTAHDCGGSGFAVCTCAGLTVDHNDFQGTIWKVGQNLGWDPHPEKGSGEHGALLWDSRYASAFTNNRFAFYAHDIPTGACVEIGNDVAAPATGNVLYEKCVDATFVSKTQTGGNALQVWGYTDNLGLDVKYLEGENLQGYALRDAGVYSGQRLAGVTVEHGLASHTNENPRYAGKAPWMTDSGVVYGQVRPAPKGGS